MRRDRLTSWGGWFFGGVGVWVCRETVEKWGQEGLFPEEVLSEAVEVRISEAESGWLTVVMELGREAESREQI